MTKEGGVGTVGSEDARPFQVGGRSAQMFSRCVQFTVNHRACAASKDDLQQLLINVVTRLTHCCHFPRNARAQMDDTHDQSGDPAAADTARNGVTGSQGIEFTRALGDTMISRVTSKKKSPHCED